MVTLDSELLCRIESLYCLLSKFAGIHSVSVVRQSALLCSKQAPWTTFTVVGTNSNSLGYSGLGSHMHSYIIATSAALDPN